MSDLFENSKTKAPENESIETTVEVPFKLEDFNSSLAQDLTLLDPDLLKGLKEVGIDAGPTSLIKPDPILPKFPPLTLDMPGQGGIDPLFDIGEIGQDVAEYKVRAGLNGTKTKKDGEFDLVDGPEASVKIRYGPRKDGLEEKRSGSIIAEKELNNKVSVTTKITGEIDDQGPRDTQAARTTLQSMDPELQVTSGVEIKTSDKTSVILEHEYQTSAVSPEGKIGLNNEGSHRVSFKGEAEIAPGVKAGAVVRLRPRNESDLVMPPVDTDINEIMENSDSGGIYLKKEKGPVEIGASVDVTENGDAQIKGAIKVKF